MKTFRAWLALCGLLFLPSSLWAQFGYETNGTNIIITNYTGPGGVVTVPTTINDLPVTDIGTGTEIVFGENSHVTSLILSNGVEVIADYALYSCVSLTNITIPDSVDYIGDDTFLGCSALSSITLPPNIRAVGFSTFQNCSALTSIAIPNGVVAIDNAAFWFCTSLTNVSIPSSVSIIGQQAFWGCVSLTNITLPTAVNDLEYETFGDCTSLTNIIIPTNISSISFAAFFADSALQAIMVDPGNAYFSSVNGVLFNADQTELLIYPDGLAGNYTVPDTVTQIGETAFENADYLTSVTDSPNDMNIGLEAFYGCFGLTNFTSSDILQNIGEFAFCYCGFTNVFIPATVTNIGYSAYNACFYLDAINVDPGNTHYSSVDGVLFDKNQVTLIQYPIGSLDATYTVPDTVTTNEDYAFEYAVNLASIVEPASLTGVGLQVFYDCSSLTNIIFGSGLQVLGEYAFEFCPALRGVYFTGNAPMADSTVFADDDPATTAYYIGGTSGWPAFSTNTGIPVALWRPSFNLTTGSPAVQSNQFNFLISWAPGIPVVVEACTNLSHPVWVPVQTNTFNAGTGLFSDPAWTNYPNRYYRLAGP